LADPHRRGAAPADLSEAGQMVGNLEPRKLLFDEDVTIGAGSSSAAA
jgi:hypothetical protein